MSLFCQISLKKIFVDKFSVELMKMAGLLAPRALPVESLVSRVFPFTDMRIVVKSSRDVLMKPSGANESQRRTERYSDFLTSIRKCIEGVVASSPPKVIMPPKTYPHHRNSIVHVYLGKNLVRLLAREKLGVSEIYRLDDNTFIEEKPSIRKEEGIESETFEFMDEMNRRKGSEGALKPKFIEERPKIRCCGHREHHSPSTIMQQSEMPGILPSQPLADMTTPLTQVSVIHCKADSKTPVSNDPPVSGSRAQIKTGDTIADSRGHEDYSLSDIPEQGVDELLGTDTRCGHEDYSLSDIPEQGIDELLGIKTTDANYTDEETFHDDPILRKDHDDDAKLGDDNIRKYVKNEIINDRLESGDKVVLIGMGEQVAGKKAGPAPGPAPIFLPQLGNPPSVGPNSPGRMPPLPACPPRKGKAEPITPSKKGQLGPLDDDIPTY